MMESIPEAMSSMAERIARQRERLNVLQQKISALMKEELTDDLRERLSGLCFDLIVVAEDGSVGTDQTLDGLESSVSALEKSVASDTNPLAEVELTHVGSQGPGVGSIIGWLTAPESLSATQYRALLEDTGVSDWDLQTAIGMSELGAIGSSGETEESADIGHMDIEGTDTFEEPPIISESIGPELIQRGLTRGLIEDFVLLSDANAVKEYENRTNALCLYREATGDLIEHLRNDCLRDDLSEEEEQNLPVRLREVIARRHEEGVRGVDYPPFGGVFQQYRDLLDEYRLQQELLMNDMNDENVDKSLDECVANREGLLAQIANEYPNTSEADVIRVINRQTVLTSDEFHPNRIQWERPLNEYSRQDLENHLRFATELRDLLEYSRQQNQRFMTLLDTTITNGNQCLEVVGTSVEPKDTSPSSGVQLPQIGSQDLDDILEGSPALADQSVDPYQALLDRAGVSHLDPQYQQRAGTGPGATAEPTSGQTHRQLIEDFVLLSDTQATKAQAEATTLVHNVQSSLVRAIRRLKADCKAGRVKGQGKKPMEIRLQRIIAQEHELSARNLTWPPPRLKVLHEYRALLVEYHRLQAELKLNPNDRSVSQALDRCVAERLRVLEVICNRYPALNLTERQIIRIINRQKIIPLDEVSQPLIQWDQNLSGYSKEDLLNHLKFTRELRSKCIKSKENNKPFMDLLNSSIETAQELHQKKLLEEELNPSMEVQSDGQSASAQVSLATDDYQSLLERAFEEMEDTDEENEQELPVSKRQKMSAQVSGVEPAGADRPSIYSNLKTLQSKSVSTRSGKWVNDRLVPINQPIERRLALGFNDDIVVLDNSDAELIRNGLSEEIKCLKNDCLNDYLSAHSTMTPELRLQRIIALLHEQSLRLPDCPTPRPREIDIYEALLKRYRALQSALRRKPNDQNVIQTLDRCVERSKRVLEELSKRYPKYNLTEERVTRLINGQSFLPRQQVASHLILWNRDFERYFSEDLRSHLEFGRQLRDEFRNSGEVNQRFADLLDESLQKAEEELKKRIKFLPQFRSTYIGRPQ